MMTLQNWMIRENATDEEVAVKVGLSRVQISRIRRGVSRPSYETATKLASITGIPAGDLICAVPSPAPA